MIAGWESALETPGKSKSKSANFIHAHIARSNKSLQCITFPSQQEHKDI